MTIFFVCFCRWTEMSCGGRYLSEKIFFTKALYAEHSPSGSEGVDVYIPDERKGMGNSPFLCHKRCSNPFFIAISILNFAEHLFQVIV